MNIQKTFNTILTSPNKHLKITLVLDICTNIKEYDLLSILKFLYKLVLKDTDLATRIFHSLVSSKIIKYKMTNCKFEYKLKRIVLGSTGKEYKNEKIDFKSQKKEITKAVNIDERFVAVDFINEKDLDVNEKCMKQVVIGERNVQSVDDFFDFLYSDMVSSEYVRREGAFKMINCFFVNEEIDDNYYKIIFEEEKKSDENKDDSKEKSEDEDKNKDITEKNTTEQRKVSTSQTIKTENITVKKNTHENTTQENITQETVSQTQEMITKETNTKENITRETVSQTQEIITKETSIKETNVQESQNDITQATEFLVDYTWEVPENILTVILQVIYSDKLTDFVSDQISFPVREHAITLLKHLYEKNTHTYIKNVLLNFINCDDWQVQVGALMAIQRLDLHIDSDLLIRLLSSEVDDVRFFALECMKNHVISDPLVLKVCWDLIDDGNESTIGKKSVFMLLKKIYEYKRIDGEKNNVLEPVTSIKEIERHGNSKEQTSIDFCSYNQVETGILSVSLLEEGVIETYRLVLYFRSYLSDIRLAVLDFVESVSDRLDDIQMLIRLLVENVLLDDNSTVIERSMCILRKVIHSIDTNTISIVVKTITDTNLHYNKDYFITTADDLVFNESGARLVGVNEILNGKVRILTVLWYYMNNTSEDMVDETEKIVSCKGLISYILYGIVQIVKGKEVEQRTNEYFISMFPTVYHKEIALCMKRSTTKNDKSMSTNATKIDIMANNGMDIDADKLYAKNKYANLSNAKNSKSVYAPNNNASNANDSISINASAEYANNTYISKLPIVNSIIQDITRMKAFYMGDHLIQFYTTETHTLLIDLLSQVLHTLTDSSTVHQLYTAMIKEKLKVKEETKPINIGVLGKFGIHDVSDISIAEEETHIDLFFKHYKYDSDFKQHIAKDDNRLIFIGSTIDYITDLQEYDFIFYESIDYIYNNTTSIDDKETKTYFTCCFNTIKRYIKYSHTYLSYTINRLIENLHPYFLYNIIDDIDFSYYFLFMKRLLVQMNRSNDKYAIKVFSHIVPYLGMKKVSINTTHMNDILVSMHDIYNFYSTDNISIMDIPDLTLRPYQIYGVKWMSFLCYYGINGILADDMGLGKTIMVLSFLANEICSILHKKRKDKRDTKNTKDKTNVKNADTTYNTFNANTYDMANNDNSNKVANDNNTDTAVPNNAVNDISFTSCNANDIPSMFDDKFTLTVEEKNIYIKNIPVEKCQRLYTYNLSEIGNDLWKSLSILIITPISLTSHWQDEIKAKYNNYLRSVIYTKKDPKYDLITITSFETYRSDYENLSKRTYFYVIVDEGHILRNRDTQLYKRILALKSKHKLVLTGTPIHNSVDDVFSLFNFLMPNYLGTEREFNKKYGLLLKKIDAGKKPSTSDFDKMSNLLNSLKSLVTPFCLRRLKKDVLKDLPPKVINDIVVELDEEDTAIYNLFECDDGDYSKGFGRVGDLLKICSHKTYVKQILSKYESEKGMIVEQERLTDAKRRKTENGDTSKSSRSAQIESYDPSVSPKIKALVDIIDQCGGKEISHKIIVFFQYKQTIDYVLKDIANLCPYLKCLRLDGTTKNRAKVVNDFQALDYNMLFITTSVGGLGLNLTSADVVVFYEHDWNPFNDLQAMDRAHRIGQKNVVNVYRLICKGTIEERKMNVQAFKVFVAERIIDDKCEEKGMDVIEKFVKSYTPPKLVGSTPHLASNLG